MRLAPVGRSARRYGAWIVRLSKSMTLRSARRPDADHAAVVEAVHLRRRAGELVHRQLQRHPLALGAVAHPVGEVEGGAAAVRDHHHVRAGVGQAAHRVRVEEHLAARLERAVVEVVAEQREERRRRRPRSSGRRGSSSGSTPCARASALHRLRRVGLVVDRERQREQAPDDSGRASRPSSTPRPPRELVRARRGSARAPRAGASAPPARRAAGRRAPCRWGGS